MEGGKKKEGKTVILKERSCFESHSRKSPGRPGRGGGGEEKKGSASSKGGGKRGRGKDWLPAVGKGKKGERKKRGKGTAELSKLVKIPIIPRGRKKRASFCWKGKRKGNGTHLRGKQKTVVKKREGGEKEREVTSFFSEKSRAWRKNGWRPPDKGKKGGKIKSTIAFPRKPGGRGGGRKREESGKGPFSPNFTERKG